MHKYRILYGAAGAIVFCTLLERWSVVGILFGAVIGVLLTFLIYTIPFSKDSKKATHLMGYFSYLFKSIINSSWKMLCCVFKRGTLLVSIVRLHPNAGEKERVLISNSITLTPGTITLEETQDEYVILALGDEAEVINAVESFEHLLKEGGCHVH